MSADMTGITSRPTKGGSVRYRAEAWDNQAGRRITKTFATAAAARAWRRDTQDRIARGEVRAAEPRTVSDAYEFWIAAARSGAVRSRGGTTYKPGVLHGYAITFESRLLKEFGRTKVGELRRIAIKRYVDKLIAEGLAAQTVKNIVVALRVLLKWCVEEELILSNPTDGLALPSGGVVRDRVASVSEAITLLAPLEGRDRAIMATAFFAGLRRGELMALRRCDIDFGTDRIEVRQAYDPRTKTFGLPKSAAGFRIGGDAPGIPHTLVPFLVPVIGYLTTDDLAFEDGPGKPFSATMLARRCRKAWKDAGLEPIGLHECRHTYASICIAAGINIKTLSTWMGHSSITITLDRYGHLLPGSAQEALGLLNAHLSKSIDSEA